MTILGDGCCWLQSHFIPVTIHIGFIVKKTISVACFGFCFDVVKELCYKPEGRGFET
jgi:hypothetical protein